MTPLASSVEALVRAFPGAPRVPLVMRAVTATALGLVPPGGAPDALREALRGGLAARLGLPARWLPIDDASLEVPDGAALREATGALGALAPVVGASALAERLGALHERLLPGSGAARGASWLRDGARRRGGTHVTRASLARDVVQRVLGPLLAARPAELAIVDPTMGAGVFLAEAIVVLVERLGLSPREAAAWVHGVDVDPVAVDVARVVVLFAGGGGASLADAVERRLVAGDAAVGPLFDGTDSATLVGALSWSRAFPHVAERGGFDAVVGNPPWIAYAGRAAQPLAPARRAVFEAESAAFARYRTLHGVLVERAARLARPGGRLGLVVPTSMADLDGYRPSRAAHDRWAEPERELVDLGAGAFEGVFQPAMVLTSLRRAQPVPTDGAPWHVARPELDDEVAAWLADLATWPTLPREAFAERGVQTSGADAHPVVRRGVAQGVPLRAGGDIAAFSRGEPSFVLDAAHPAAARPASWWATPGVLVRQTARYPIAALGDGVAFRNSILAGLPTDVLDAPGLAAYLNSTLVRFAHYQRFRDARQGMPQLKVGHLRATPWPRAPGALARELSQLGEALGARDEGVPLAAQEALDAAVARAWAAPRGIVERAQTWARAYPAPRRRGAPSTR